ncbi:hypothetical protein ACHAW6_010707 [Cyclotella cf. meneghiniana]
METTANPSVDTTATNAPTTRKRPRHASSPPRPYVLLPFHGEHKRAVSSLAFAPALPHTNQSFLVDSSSSEILARCASASADGSAKIWDISRDMLNEAPLEKGDGSTSRGLKPALTLQGHARGINDVSWSPSTMYLATASDDKTLRLWDVSSSSSSSSSEEEDLGDALVEFRGHLDFVFSCSFSPASDLLASGSFDSTVKLWDVRCGSCVCTLPAHSDPVTSVCFNYDGTCVASASHDGLVRVWDVGTGECLKTIVGEESSEGVAVGCVKFSPNGRFLLSGSLDGRVRLWDLVAGRWCFTGVKSETERKGRCAKTYRGHTNSRFCVFSTFSTVNPSRNVVVSGSEDGKVYLYDLQSRMVRQTLDGHGGDEVLAVDAHDTLELIGSGGMTNDKTVRFWGVAGGLR